MPEIDTEEPEHLFWFFLRVWDECAILKNNTAGEGKQDEISLIIDLCGLRNGGKHVAAICDRGIRRRKVRAGL